MSDSSVFSSVGGGVARITLNRPDRLNALTRAMMLRLGEILEEAKMREDVRVISITGAGRGFCSGQDLSERDPRKLSEPLDLAAIQRELFHPVIRGLAEMPKPVVRIPMKPDGVSNREAGRHSDLMPDSQGFVSLGRVDHRCASFRGQA